MLVSVSELKDYMRCPQRAFNAHRLRALPVQTPTALSLGTLWHLAMQLLHQDKDGSIVFTAHELASHGFEVQDSKAVAKLKILRSAYQAAQDRHLNGWYDSRCIGVEVEYRMPLGRHTLVGRLDTIISGASRIWHRQHKTTSILNPSYLKHFQEDWHEVAYHALARHNGIDLYATDLWVVAYRDPKPFQTYVIPPPKDPARALAAMERIADRIESEDEPIRNRAACYGDFYTTPCPYLGVCNGHAQLSDTTLYTIHPPRYAEDPNGM